MSHKRFAVILAGSLLVVPAFPSLLAEPQENLPAATVGSAKAPDTRVRLDCSVQGTPEELPDDVYIRNVGSTVIPKGTKVDWSADGTTQKGVVVVPVDLTPGAGTFANGIVQGGLEPGHPCTCTTAARPGPDLAKPVSVSRVVPPSPLGCVVRGTPARFPDDLYILNNGKSAVAAGTTLHWSIPNTNREGDYKLTAELAVGKAMTIPDVVTGGMPVGVKCVVTLK
jgi:hypothetical protein